MKKRLLIAFALALMVPWAARAQNDCTPIGTFPVTYGFEASEGFTTTVTSATACTTDVVGTCWRNEATVQTGTNPTRVWKPLPVRLPLPTVFGTSTAAPPHRKSTAVPIR